MNEVTTRQQEPLLPQEQSQPVNLLESISRAASDPNVDVAKVERLMSLYERMQAKQAEGEFVQAMSRVQSRITRVAADANNPQTRSQYASYAALDRALRPIYTAEGLSISYDTEPAGDASLTVLAYVSHAAGHTRTYRVTMPADGKGAKGGDVMTRTHATGSAITYGMRYLLKAIFNVAVGDDDDGNAASSEPVTPEQAAHIRELLEAGNVDQAAFLNWARAEGIEEIPASKYERIVRQLERRLAE